MLLYRRLFVLDAPLYHGACVMTTDQLLIELWRDETDPQRWVDYPLLHAVMLLQEVLKTDAELSFQDVVNAAHMH